MRKAIALLVALAARPASASCTGPCPGGGSCNNASQCYSGICCADQSAWCCDNGGGPFCQMKNVSNCTGCGVVCPGAPANPGVICNGGLCKCDTAHGYLQCGTDTSSCTLAQCCVDTDCITDLCHTAKCTSHACVVTAKSCPVQTCQTANACDSSTGNCKPTLAADGTSCGGPMGCFSSGQCQSGVCTGVPKVCPSPGPCQKGVCDANTGNCASQDVDNGTACASTNPCLTSTKCMSGSCTGTAVADGTACTAAGCAGQCQKGACLCAAGSDGGADDAGSDLAVAPMPSPFKHATGGSCSCRVGGAAPSSAPWVVALALLLWTTRRRLRASDSIRVHTRSLSRCRFTRRSRS
jgi:MYXO-CTERM domain-containing protein